MILATHDMAMMRKNQPQVFKSYRSSQTWSHRHSLDTIPIWFARRRCTAMNLSRSLKHFASIGESGSKKTNPEKRTVARPQNKNIIWYEKRVSLCIWPRPYVSKLPTYHSMLAGIDYRPTAWFSSLLRLTMNVTPFIPFQSAARSVCSLLRHHICVTAIQEGAWNCIKISVSLS